MIIIDDSHDGDNESDDDDKQHVNVSTPFQNFEKVLQDVFRKHHCLFFCIKIVLIINHQ